MSDIRKWFVKAQCKNNDKAAELTKQAQPEKGSKEGSGRRKTSKYFAEKPRSKDEKDTEQTPTKRKSQKVKEEPPSKKLHSETAYGDADCALPNLKKNSVAVTSNKNLGSGSVGGVVQKCANTDDIDEENEIKDTEIVLRSDGRGRGRSASTSAGGRGKGGGHSALAADADEVEENNIEDIDEEAPTRSGGVGRGGKNTSAAPAGGRGRGGRGGGFMNFGERKPPPHKGEKEVPEGASDCLSGLTFVLSGTLDSLEREEAVDLIKRHGGRVTGSVSKKTNYLLCDEDIGGRKSSDAKRLGTRFLTEDGLFDMIRASNHTEGPTKENLKKTADQVSAALPKTSVQNAEINKVHPGTSSVKAPKGSVLGVSHTERKGKDRGSTFLTWTDKYRPKVPNEIVGNQSLVKQLHDWLAHWRENFLDSGNKAKRKGQNGSGVKKAVLLSGTPGIGKTTSAKLVSQMLGFQLIEVNASDSRGKADIHIRKGIGGSTANSMKELVSNEALSLKKDWSKDPKTVLIMDEVDGMSAGDRGGVADLIASIKISKIPIICICNDRYSQKLKSLVNYCMPLNFRKPTKQQMAKRLCHIAKAEGLQVNEIALEELAERVNGDMRMALNHLQYMSLSMSVIKYDDVRHRLFSSSKDEDISPFTAVNKLFGFDGGKLRMDERIDLSTSDADLVPLLIQENYVNYRPSLAGKDENGVKHMSLIASAAESIADGDIINVKIRRHRQWQLFQNASVSSCIIPAALMHGQRQILEQGENNYNRFGGWLGKNSTMGKNIRLLEDLNFHFVASCASNMGRGTLRLDYLNLLLKHLTNPLRELPKDEAVQRVMEMRNFYSITPEDYDAIVELSKFPGLPNPADGIPTAVKTALTKAYKQRKLRTRVAEDIALPGMKKPPKKRVAAILEPAAGGAAEEEGDVMAETDEEKASDTDNLDETMNGEKLESDLRSLNSKGIQVQVDLKGKENASAKKTPTGRGRGRSSTDAAEKKAGRGTGGSAAKRKR